MVALIANAVRRRLAASAFHPRHFSSSLSRHDDASTPPSFDATSALDYKTRTRHRPPPLPVADLPSRTAEQAVTNILYNTPPPSLQPFKKHVLNCLVQNEPGVLSRVSGFLAGRGFNIDSLVVCSTEVRDLSRMSIVLRGQDGVIEQACRQLEGLVPVWAVLDYTNTHCIERELLLVKVSTLGPEYLEDQLLGGPTHAPRRADVPDAHPHAAPDAPPHAAPAPLTPTQVLRLKNDNLQAMSVLANQFGGRIVDVSENTVIVELCGKTSRVDAFLRLLRPFGVIEAARTGLMVMPRTPMQTSAEDADADLDGEGGAVDASQLPPG